MRRPMGTFPGSRPSSSPLTLCVAFPFSGSIHMSGKESLVWPGAAKR